MYLFKQLIKNKLFIAGFSLIVGCFMVSLFYLIFFEDYIPSASLLYEENGKPLPAPYSGSIYPPFGTDEFGRDIAIVMLIGAKYTIGAAMLITVLRVIPAVFIGLFLQLFLNGLKRPLKSIADSINYFPITLLAFLLLNWATREGVLMQENIPSFGLQILLYIAVLSLIFIPLNSVLIANEVELVYQKEFIECSRTLGAGTWQIIIRHIRPFLVPQLFVIFIREFIQTLILMAHLGILGIFIGGTVFMENLFGRSIAASRSGEWAGTLGMWWDYLWTTYPWIAFIPIVFLTLLILAAKAMLDSLNQVISSEEGKKEELQKTVDPPKLDTLEPFQLLHIKSQ